MKQVRTVVFWWLALATLAVPSSATMTARDLVEAGTERLRSGETAEALSLFEKALVVEPESPEIFYNMGCVHFQLGEFDKAIEKFQKVVLRTRDAVLEAKAVYNLGNCSFRLGQSLLDADLKKAVSHFDDAIGHYRTRLDLVEDDPDSSHNIMVVKLLMKDLVDRLKKQEEEKKKQEEDKEKSIPERIRDLLRGQIENLLRTKAVQRGATGVEGLDEILRLTKKEASLLEGALALGAEERDALLIGETVRRGKVQNSLEEVGQVGLALSRDTGQKVAGPLEEFWTSSIQSQQATSDVLKKSVNLELTSEEKGEFSSALHRMNEGIRSFEEQLPELKAMILEELEGFAPELHPNQEELTKECETIAQELEQIVQGMVAAQAQAAQGQIQGMPASPGSANPGHGGAPGAPGAAPPEVDPKVLEAFEAATPHVQAAQESQTEAVTSLAAHDLVGSESPQERAVTELQEALSKFPKDDKDKDQDQDQQDQGDQGDEKEDEKSDQDQDQNQDQDQDQDQDQNQDQNQDQSQPEAEQPSKTARPTEAEEIIQQERNRRRQKQKQAKGRYRRVDRDW